MTVPMDHVGLEQTDHGFRQGIVVRVPNTADRRLDPRLGEALGVLNRHALNSPVRMVDEAGSPQKLPLVERLFQGIEHELGPDRA
jgi:hypothetical protein